MIASLLALLGRALVDSLSVGTLIIPIMMIVRRRRVDWLDLVVYLATVATIYFALGVGLLAGIDVVSRVTQWQILPYLTFALGVGLFIFGVFARTPQKRAIGEENPRQFSSGVIPVVGLGLAASLTEAATMLPYIAAMGIISGYEATLTAQLGAIAGYCLVMITPALIIAGVTTVIGSRIFPRLERIIPRLEYEAKVTLLWIAAIAGFVIASRSAGEIGWIG